MNHRFDPIRCPVVWLWLPVVVWMGLIFYLSAQSQLPSAAENWLDMLLKKGGHFAGYAVLAFLWWRIANRRSWSGQVVLAVAFVLTVLYASSDEVHQSFVPGRHPSPVDLAIDAAGAATGLAFVAWMRH